VHAPNSATAPYSADDAKLCTQQPTAPGTVTSEGAENITDVSHAAR